MMPTTNSDPSVIDIASLEELPVVTEEATTATTTTTTEKEAPATTVRSRDRDVLISQMLALSFVGCTIQGSASGGENTVLG